jgi:hypothetical protein
MSKPVLPPITMKWTFSFNICPTNNLDLDEGPPPSSPLHHRGQIKPVKIEFIVVDRRKIVVPRPQNTNADDENPISKEPNP